MKPDIPHKTFGIANRYLLVGFIAIMLVGWASGTLSSVTADYFYGDISNTTGVRVPYSYLIINDSGTFRALPGQSGSVISGSDVTAVFASALSNVPIGGTIAFKGTFNNINGLFLINKPVVIDGQNSYFKYADSSSYLISGDAVNGFSGMFTIIASDVTIKNANIDLNNRSNPNVLNGYGSGIMVNATLSGNSVNNTHILFNNISDSNYVPIYIVGEPPLYVVNPHIEGNHLVGTTKVANHDMISLFGTNGSIVTHNTLNNTFVGIHAYGYNLDALIEGNYVEATEELSASGDGIEVGHGNYPNSNLRTTIKDNHVDNKFANARGNGIGIFAGSNFTIVEGNQIYNSDIGIKIDGSSAGGGGNISGILIFNNQVNPTGSATYGMSLQNITVSTISNNFIQGHQAAIKINKGVNDSVNVNDNVLIYDSGWTAINGVVNNSGNVMQVGIPY